MTSIVSFQKLFIFCWKLLPMAFTYSSNYPSSFPRINCFSPLLSCIPFTFITTIIASKIRILDIIFEFFDGINLKKWRNQFELETKNWQHNGCWYNNSDNVHVTFIKTFLGFWFYAKKNHYEMHAFCVWGDFTLKVIVVKIAMSSQLQCKYVYLESFMDLFAIWSKVPYLLKTLLQT